MMIYTCPSCKKENSLDLDFTVESYICKSCSMLSEQGKIVKKVKKPTENVVLKVGQKGELNRIEYTVVAIVVKKYGSSVFWREYYLKDKNLNDAFLSESDGHWVMMFPKPMPAKEFKFNAEFEGKNYRWYESSPNSIESATGFFEDKLKFSLATYKEFVNGTEMVSVEQVGTDRNFLWGKHVPKNEIKKAFKLTHLPNYSGIGIVQPYYFNVRQLTNVFAVVALLMSALQFYNTVSRDNYEVFNDNIRFDAVRSKELISKSFDLNGASAPLNVKLSSNVDNSWANIELSLVNENNNEIEYVSQDIEQYHGYESGESWFEGSKEKEFNFCGVAPGKYHFTISAQKQGFEQPAGETFYSPDGKKTFAFTGDGFVDVTLPSGEKTAVNLENLQQNDSTMYAELEEAKAFKLKNPNFSTNIADTDSANPNFAIQANWKPVSFWNYFIILGIMVVIVLLNYWGKYTFDKAKWENSNYSPFDK